MTNHNAHTPQMMDGKARYLFPGVGSICVERVLWADEVAGSNPVLPIKSADYKRQYYEWGRCEWRTISANQSEELTRVSEEVAKTIRAIVRELVRKVLRSQRFGFRLSIPEEIMR